MSSGIRNFVIFALALVASWFVGAYVPPTWTIEKTELDVQTDTDGRLSYIYRDKPVHFDPVPLAQAQLHPETINGSTEAPLIREEYVLSTETSDGESKTFYYKLSAKHHWGYWSLLPACGSRGAPVLAHQGTGHLPLGRHHLRGSRSEPIRPHKRGLNPLISNNQCPPGSSCSTCGSWGG